MGPGAGEAVRVSTFKKYAANTDLSQDSASDASEAEDEDVEDGSISTAESGSDDLSDVEETLEWTGFASEGEDKDLEDEEQGEEEVPASSAPTLSGAPGAGECEVMHFVACTNSVLGRYIPPHLRNQTVSTDEAEALAKLSRQLKGLLNR